MLNGHCFAQIWEKFHKSCSRYPFCLLFILLCSWHPDIHILFSLFHLIWRLWCSRGAKLENSGSFQGPSGLGAHFPNCYTLIQVSDDFHLMYAFLYFCGITPVILSYYVNLLKGINKTPIWNVCCDVYVPFHAFRLYSLVS